MGDGEFNLVTAGSDIHVFHSGGSPLEWARSLGAKPPAFGWFLTDLPPVSSPISVALARSAWPEDWAFSVVNARPSVAALANFVQLIHTGYVVHALQMGGICARQAHPTPPSC